MTGTYDVEVDVAIAGGGACGMMTALQAARDKDLVVAVFEKSTREWCNAAISSGSLAAGGTRWQQAAGIDDSPARHADDIISASGDEEWRPVVHAVCEAAPQLVGWIADTGYPVELGTDMPRAGMSVPRLHTDTGRLGGGRLMRHLRGLLNALPNVAFVDEAPVAELVSHEGGVSGLVVEQNGSRQRVRARTVVLATDGFANSPSLVSEHLAHLGDPFYGGVTTWRSPRSHHPEPGDHLRDRPVESETRPCSRPQPAGALNAATTTALDHWCRSSSGKASGGQICPPTG